MAGEMMGRFNRIVMGLVLVGVTLMPMQAQRGGYRGNDRYDQGLRRGYYGHNGGYNDRYDHRRYDGRDQYNRQQGGIGPGKGALIGGAAGAVLGAVFGGGLKGALIAGGAGAGVGAIAGKVHQDNRRDDWRDYRDGRR